MPENDRSRSLEDDSGRRTTGLVEMGGRQAGFLLSPQSSALSSYQRDTTLAAKLVFSDRLIVIF